MKTVTYDLSKIDAVAKMILAQIEPGFVITLTGSLGAGKTALTQVMLQQLGVQEPIISPTFTYFNQYQSSSGLQVYHFDLYRLKNMQEFEQMGFVEYLGQSNSLVIIEWPEIIQFLFKKNVLHINISNNQSESRILTVQKK